MLDTVGSWSGVTSHKDFPFHDNKRERIDVDRLLLFLAPRLIFPSTKKIEHHNDICIDIDSSCV